MHESRTFLALALAASFLPAGCSDEGPVGVERGPSRTLALASKAAVQSVPDLSGEWNWSSVEVLRMPPFVAAGVGVIPEGKNTQARCVSAGTMTLFQTGDTFDGEATKTFNSCETNGGQLFEQPATPFDIVDGRITGMSIRFSFQSMTVKPCPHTAVLSEDQNGVAIAMNGTGRCIVPGHPQSESPLELDPPPGGTSSTVNWEAVRL